MKLSLAALVLTLLPSLTNAIPIELNKESCPGLLMGSEELKVPDFIGELIGTMARLRDLPKYIDAENSILKMNPETKAQLEDLRRLFRGNRDTLDAATLAFRDRLSTDSLEKNWQALDGWEVRDLTKLNNELLLFGRVVGEKDGVLLVALPPTEILWENADDIPIQFYYLAPVEYLSKEPVDVFHGMNVEGPPKEAKIKELNEQVHAKVYASSRAGRSPTLNLQFRDEMGFFFAEKSIALSRRDALKHPRLSNLLSVFN